MGFCDILGNIMCERGQFRISLVKIQDLADDNYDTWNGQRYLNEMHAQELFESFKKSIDETGYIKYCSSIPHIVITPENKKYIIDGQHRIHAYRKICEEDKNAFEVPVLYERCTSEDGIKEAFDRSNTLWDQSDETKKKIYGADVVHKANSRQDDWIVKLWNIKLKCYGGTKGMISRSSKPQSPHINDNDFLEKLKSLEQKGIKFTSYESLEKAFELSNSYIRQLESTKKYASSKPKKFEKCEKYNCYIGLHNDFTEVIATLVSRDKRRPIGKAVRMQCWKNKFGDDAANGQCEVCGIKISIDKFEAGHIIAQAIGGSDLLDNLVPVCALCNRSMGIENLYEYKDRHYR